MAGNLNPPASVEQGRITLRLYPHTAAEIARLLRTSEPSVTDEAAFIYKDLLTMLFTLCAQAGFQHSELSHSGVDSVNEQMTDHGLT